MHWCHYEVSLLKQIQYLINYIFIVLNRVYKREVTYGILTPNCLRYLTYRPECRLSQILSIKCSAQEWCELERIAGDQN